MGFGYHVQALKKDISYRTGCLSGRANIAVIQARIEERKRAAVDPELEKAVDQLGIYFDQLREGLGEPAFQVALKQEFGGEMVDDEDAAILAKAEARKVNTAITKAEAKRLAKLIEDHTASWGAL